jgi:uncharacterized protein
MRKTTFSSRAARSVALLVLIGAPAAAAYMIWGGDSTQVSSQQTQRLELVTSQGVVPLEIEVAVTQEQQATGLMYRTTLADNAGMLFPYPEARELTMWMKNTFIPLDMIFIRADGTILRIEAMTEPLSERVVSSGGAVTGVLEIAGGAAARLGLKAGDRVRHPHFTGGVR